MLMGEFHHNIDDKGRLIPFNTESVLNYIKTEQHTFQEILDETKLSATELNVALITLEMEGIVLKLSNNSYVAT